MWSLRNIYLYLVSFVSLILIIAGLITFLGSVSDIFFPTEYYPPKLERMNNYNKDLGMSREQYEAQIEKEMQQYKANEQNRRVNRSIRSLSMVIVALPFYLYHWRKIQADRSQVQKQEIPV